MPDAGDYGVARTREFRQEWRALRGKLLVPDAHLLDAKLMLEYCADCIDDVVGKFFAVIEQRDTRGAQRFQARRQRFRRSIRRAGRIEDGNERPVMCFHAVLLAQDLVAVRRIIGSAQSARKHGVAATCTAGLPERKSFIQIAAVARAKSEEIQETCEQPRWQPYCSPHRLLQWQRTFRRKCIPRAWRLKFRHWKNSPAAPARTTSRFG